MQWGHCVHKQLHVPCAERGRFTEKGTMSWVSVEGDLRGTHTQHRALLTQSGTVAGT